MSETSLEGCRVAILATNGFEHSELFEPKEALEDVGAEVHVVAPEAGQIKSWQSKNWGEPAHVDLSLDDANPEDYDALVLPGGVMNPDALRINPDAIDFIRAFVDAGKPIAAICHGPWTLIEADAVRGRVMTSWPSLRTDLVNAGAKWVDEEVVADKGLITSRKPADLPAFNRKMIQEFHDGRHAGVQKKRVQTFADETARRLQ